MMRRYLEPHFASAWGPLNLLEIYPGLNELQSLQPEVGNLGMDAPARIRYLDAFDSLFTDIDDASRKTFLKVMHESVAQTVEFLFTPLPSVEEKVLQLPSAQGVQSVSLPSHFREPPILTILKEVHRMQFYSVLAALRTLVRDFSPSVLIPDPTQGEGIPLREIEGHTDLAALRSQAPRNALGVHTDQQGFCFVGYFNKNGLLSSLAGENAMVIHLLNNNATLVAPFKNGLAQGPGVYRDPNSHTLRSRFVDGLANGAALYITKLWQHVLIGEVVNGAFQNYKSIAQNQNAREQQLGVDIPDEEVQIAGEVACEVGDFVDGTSLIRDPLTLANIKLLPKTHQNIQVNASGDVLSPNRVLQTSSGVLLGTSQRCASQTTEFEIKNNHFYRRFWPTPTMVSARLPRAPAEMSDKKKNLETTDKSVKKG